MSNSDDSITDPPHHWFTSQTPTRSISPISLGHQRTPSPKTSHPTRTFTLPLPASQTLTPPLKQKAKTERKLKDRTRTIFKSKKEKGKGKEKGKRRRLKEVMEVVEEIDYGKVVICYDEIESEEDEISFGEVYRVDWDVDVCFTPDDGWNYRFEDAGEGRRLAGGTLNGMVKYLTSPKVDMEFTNAFIYTYKSFTTPKVLLDKVLEQYDGQIVTGEEAQEGKTVRTRCLGFLVNWLSEDMENFSKSMFLRLKGLLETEKREGGIFAAKLERYMKKAYLGKKEDGIYRITEIPPDPILPKDFEERWDFVELDPLEVARQLSIVDFEYFQKIVKSEFMNQAWSKHKERAPNIINIIDRSNRISKWVSVKIVSTPVVKERSKMYKQFLLLAWELYQMKNFCAAVAVSAGLNNAAVHRLRFTKEKVNNSLPDAEEMLEQLTAISDATGAYKKYREEISKAVPPCIPHVGVYLTDLTYIEDGNDDIIEGLVNFNKRRLIFQTIRGFRDFQTTPYNFERVTPIQDHINKMLVDYDDVTDRDLFDFSLLAEPRGAESSEIL